ncbi:DUF3267 domain-containing protein [Jeotgalibacillus proteolyticus]|uniref:DUF3267 domain-containing protein n=1 Tax=Jeotgalibacillus proteolyticus TaxID=2082395 RepID=A0A2S5GHE7_9BACL|nr:DUF3267 domain-containing protein [Jeotgalibacillus proteolyticus]PPA72409.1 DUF3267 domain-containing protein [Jeotgalibacillus proteolyticus]
MHCWKSINVKKQYGFYRIFLLSMILVLAVFSFLHVLFQIMSQSPLYDQYFSLFIIGVFIIYPAHKLFHVLPLISYLSQIKLKTRFQFYFVPVMSVRVKKPIPKTAFILALVFPFIFINGVLLMGASAYPNYSHYFTMLTAYHTGICLVDFLYAKCLFKSPKDAYIEEYDEGYEILIPVKDTGYNQI